MLSYKDLPKTGELYQLFSNQPYVPATSWTTNRGFRLDPLYQHTVTEYVADLKLQKLEYEFVPDVIFNTVSGGSN
jgi:hypothetical protein